MKSYETVQAEARKTGTLLQKINGMEVDQGELNKDNFLTKLAFFRMHQLSIAFS